MPFNDIKAMLIMHHTGSAYYLLAYYLVIQPRKVVKPPICWIFLQILDKSFVGCYADFASGHSPARLKLADLQLGV